MKDDENQGLGRTQITMLLKICTDKVAWLQIQHRGLKFSDFCISDSRFKSGKSSLTFCCIFPGKFFWQDVFPWHTVTGDFWTVFKGLFFHSVLLFQSGVAECVFFSFTVFVQVRTCHSPNFSKDRTGPNWWMLHEIECLNLIGIGHKIDGFKDLQNNLASQKHSIDTDVHESDWIKVNFLYSWVVLDDFGFSLITLTRGFSFCWYPVFCDLRRRKLGLSRSTTNLFRCLRSFKTTQCPVSVK